jgi:hypothetical protein
MLWSFVGSRAIPCACCFVVYILSYYLFSRHGYHVADTYRWHGFYFVVPESRATIAMNDMMNSIFNPLVKAELWLGTGRYPASIPFASRNGNDNLDDTVLAGIAEATARYLPCTLLAILTWLFIYWNSVIKGRFTISAILVFFLFLAIGLSVSSWG